MLQLWIETVVSPSPQTVTHIVGLEGWVPEYPGGQLTVIYTNINYYQKSQMAIFSN